MQIFQDKPSTKALELELNCQKRMGTGSGRITVSNTPVRLFVWFAGLKSVITQDIVLAAGAKRVDFVTHVDWQETEKILKAAFPVAIKSSLPPTIQHGAIARPTVEYLL